MLNSFQAAVDGATLEWLKAGYDVFVENSRNDGGYGVLEGQRDWQEPDLIGDYEEIIRQKDDGDILEAEEQLYVHFDNYNVEGDD